MEIKVEEEQGGLWLTYTVTGEEKHESWQTLACQEWPTKNNVVSTDCEGSSSVKFESCQKTCQPIGN